MQLEEEKVPIIWRWELFIPLIFCGIVNIFLIVMEAKPPFADVFLFKEAGYRLATEGKFLARNLPHLPADLDFVYAYYVPLYSFFYGLWAIAFGTSLKASIAFDQAIKMVRVGLAFWLVWPGLRHQYLVSRLFRVMTLLTFCIVGLLPAYTDRPDLLASCFGLISLLILSRRGSSGAAFAGMALGLSAATSPVSGIFFAAMSLLFVRSLTNRIGLLISGIFTFSVCVLPILILDPDAMYRFGKQIGFSTLPLIGLPVLTIVEEMYKTFWLAGKVVTLPAVYLCVVAAILAAKSTYRGTWFKLMIRVCLFFPVVCFVWTYQFRYFVFPLIVSTICFLVILSNEWNTRWAKVCHVGFLLVMLPHLSTEVRNLAYSFNRPEAASPEAIREAVLQHIHPKARLAISSDQYFTFRPHREVAMAYYVCDRLEKYDAIFISAADIATADVRPPCHGKRDLFEVDLDLRVSYQPLPFGEPVMAGGVLFRKSKEQKSDAVAFQN